MAGSACQQSGVKADLTAHKLEHLLPDPLQEGPDFSKRLPACALSSLPGRLTS